MHTFGDFIDDYRVLETIRQDTGLDFFKTRMNFLRNELICNIAIESP